MKSTSPVTRIAAVLAALLAVDIMTPGSAAPSPDRFPTELAAVVAAAERYNPVSIREDREFMGAVLRIGTGYSYTVGAGEPGRNRITVRISVPDGAEVVAFWHTHGARQNSNRYFSNVDTELVEAWQKPFYLADYTGSLKVIVPGGRTLSKLLAHRLGLPARNGYARGDVVIDARGEPVKIATRSGV